MGCGIIPDKDSGDYFSGGQVRTVVPGEGPCLVCINGIDNNQAAWETLSEEEKGRRIKAGYITGFDINPTASILHLNTTVASQAISQAIKLLMNGAFRKQFYLFYDQRKGQLQPIKAYRHSKCPVCGSGGILGRGFCRDVKKPNLIGNIPQNILMR